MRRLMNLAFPMSLLLLAATVVLGIHSLYRSNGIGFVRNTFQFRVGLWSGIITFDVGTRYADLPVENGWYVYSQKNSEETIEFFAWRHEVLETGLAGWDVRIIKFPIPVLSFCLIIVPVTSRKRWSRRVRTGMCSICHYNLTGNTSGTCPECGTALVRKANEDRSAPPA